MERYEIIFRHARFEHDFPSEIKEKLDEWRSSRFSEEDDYENWKKQDLINEIATFLWSAKKMRKLEEYSSKFEIGGEEENIFKHLLELCHEIEGESDRFEKDFLYAQGFCLVYEFDIAVTLLRECLQNKETSIEFKIKVRKLLDNIYTYSDSITQKAADDNTRELIKLQNFDIDECKKYLQHCCIFYSEEEESFIVEVLKKHNEKELWDILYENSFREEEYLVNIYERIKPEISLNDGIYIEIFEYWLEIRAYENIDIEIERVRNNFDDPLILKRFEIKKLIKQGTFDEASNLIDEVLALDTKDPETILYKMQVLFLKNEYLETLEWIENYGQNYDLRYIFWKKVVSLFKIDREDETVEYFIECYNSGKLDDSFITSIIANNELPEGVMIRVLDKLITSIKPEKDWGTPSVFLPYVFSITENYEKKGEIRYYLIDLYLHVNTIKYMLKINPIEVNEIYHYSQPDSLNYLPKYSESVGGDKLRLGNVAYLNDPEEGKVFYEILKKKNENVLEDLVVHTDLMYENTYLACFSRKEDFLPMWVQYASDATGNCYAINTSIFNQFESEFEERLYRKITHNRFKNKNNKYVLYRVFYYGSGVLSDEDEEILGFCDAISNMLERMKNYFSDEQIKDLVNQLLSEIRYLFKDIAYASEDEIRVICIDHYDEKKLLASTNGGYRFYMELDADIYFNRVILGPKAIDVKKKATYLSCCQNVGKVEKSKIKYV